MKGDRRRQPSDVDRLELLRDARYFAVELRRRFEALEDTEPDGRKVTVWQQAAGLVGKAGRLAAQEAVQERRERERDARAERIREAFG